MSLAKACPHCRRLYTDVSLNFCLQDGETLSGEFEFPEFIDSQSEVVTETRVLPEVETLVRSKSRKSRVKSSPIEGDEWVYQKTKRTESAHPELTSANTSTRPISKWTSSDYVRQITFEITGKHTFHAQENLEILRKFLNGRMSRGKFKKTSWRLGHGLFENAEGRFDYDFQKSANPTATKFLLELIRFLSV